MASLLRESNASRAPSQRTREGRPSPSHIIILHFLQSSPTTSSENGVQEHSNAGPGSRLRRHRPSLECALRRLQREQGPSSHVFMTERDGPMTPKAFHALFGRIGARAKMQFPIHPHMLRHGCGYALANAGHDTRALQAWLGHKNIQHTVRYTELSPHRFKDFWR